MPVLALALILLQTGQAAPAAPNVATPVAPVQVTAAAPADPRDRMVCRREHVLGSNRPQRICLTQRQWDAERDQSRQSLRDVREQPTPLPAGGGR